MEVSKENTKTYLIGYLEGVIGKAIILLDGIPEQDKKSKVIDVREYLKDALELSDYIWNNGAKLNN
jgi:hypothetical protein